MRKCHPLGSAAAAGGSLRRLSRPTWIARLIEALKRRGIHDLYVHQTKAVEAALAGRSTVVVTPTASGKTMCYNLPVLNEILANPPRGRFICFRRKRCHKTKWRSCTSFREELDVEFDSYVYDGDTPATLRPAIREAGHIVVTNPDMLHTGILPHHTKWVRLFENLKYVVIDELHTYRGVFGSHVANVLRRLRRICEFYGSEPQFLCSSATIANPEATGRTADREAVKLIDDNGAPQGEKHFIFFNPPVVSRRRVARAGAESRAAHRRQVFAPRRADDRFRPLPARDGSAADVFAGRYGERRAGHHRKRAADIRGYRGGYLPSERRAIERGLRNGDVLGVVSTNALELGIDVGRLDACVMVGYPGTIASHVAASRPRRAAARHVGRGARRVQRAAGSIHRPAPRLLFRPVTGTRPHQPGQPDDSRQPYEVRGV